MTGGKFFILGLVIFSFNGWGLEWANAQYKIHEEIILSSGPQPEAAQEMAPPKAPAAEESRPTGKMLKGKAIPPERKETPYPAPGQKEPGAKDKPYPAPELKELGAKDKPYPAPELKKPVEPKKPAVAVPAPPTPPAKPAPTEPTAPGTRPPLQPRGE